MGNVVQASFQAYHLGCFKAEFNAVDGLLFKGKKKFVGMNPVHLENNLKTVRIIYRKIYDIIIRMYKKEVREAYIYFSKFIIFLQIGFRRPEHYHLSPVD